MGTACYPQLNEYVSDGLVQTISRGFFWTDAESYLNKNGIYPPKYASAIKAKASAEFWARYNYWGDERARIYDCDNSFNGDLMLSETITNNTWVYKEVNLVSKGKVPSTLTTAGSGIFTPKKPYITWQTYADVQQKLGVRKRRIDISWTDPTLTISTPSSTGGKITFANSSSSTATYSGNQKYAITHHLKTCVCTITAVPDSGYTFSHWSDDSNNKNAKRTLSFTDSDLTGTATTKTYSAVFVKIAPPEFTSVAMTYSGAQISATNKVPAGEGFLISVGIK